MIPSSETLQPAPADWTPPADFRERFPWIGGDLQTLRNTLFNRLGGEHADLSPWPARRVSTAMADGSGDRLSAELHAGGRSKTGDRADDRPLSILIHGLTGCADSGYMRNSSRALLEDGGAVLRLNLRGAGPLAGDSRFHYHAGRSEDLRDFLGGLMAAEPGLCAGGFHLAGYSLGANMMLKFLAEYGADFPIVAAVSVSAPLDLKATQERMMAPRNRFYHHYLLRRMKAETSAGVLEAAGMTGADLQGLQWIYDYDERIVAAANGFASADDYYRRCSAGPFLERIAIPTLLIHARNDPWIPASIYEAAQAQANRQVKVVLSPEGGHVGFHGRGGRTAWHDLCLMSFFQRPPGSALAGPAPPGEDSLRPFALRQSGQPGIE